MKRVKKILLSGSLLMAIAVILGAFGAHTLENAISSDHLDTYMTGNRYHFYHGLGILILGGLAYHHYSKWLRWSATFLITGILLFSGSLYLLAIRELIGMNTSWLGPVTPIGGLCFITGWILLFVHFFQNKDNE